MRMSPKPPAEPVSKARAVASGASVAPGGCGRMMDRQVIATPSPGLPKARSMSGLQPNNILAMARDSLPTDAYEFGNPDSLEALGIHFANLPNLAD